MRDTTELSSCSKEELDEVAFQHVFEDCKSFLRLDSVIYDQDNVPVFFCDVYFDSRYIRFNIIRSLSYSQPDSDI